MHQIRVYTVQPARRRAACRHAMARCVPPGLFALALLAGACTAPPADTPAATPQRPTFGSSATTTAAGTIEVEWGVLQDPGDLTDTPLTVKFGADEHTEYFVRASPLIHVVGDSERHSGFGDLGLGGRWRVQDESPDSAAWALQAALKFPTASEDEGLGTGNQDALLAVIRTRTIGAATFNAFYQLELLGQDGSQVDVGHDLALALGAPVDGRLSAFGELTEHWIPEQDIQALFLTTGLAFAVTPAWVLDTAVIVGLNDDAPGLQVTVGFTRNFGRFRPEPEGP